MTIKEIKGNILDTPASVIVHGCNAQGKMNSGVAKLIRQKYPKTYEEYMNHYNMYGLKLGEVIPVQCEQKWIVNAITQKYYGNGGKRYVDYTAIRSCLKRVKVLFYGYKSIATVRLGCGLGGGDWDIVKKIIQEELEEFEVLVYYL